jgi:serine protease Do
LVATNSSRADNVDKLEQQAFRAAAAAVADSVVQIRTVGGLEQLGDQVLAQGPTTGLILTADGYIVSSAINFAQQPASVLVRLPGGEQRPAEIVGRDTNRMLVLLKVQPDKPLPTPVPAPSADIHVGDWAVAVGRTYDADRLNVSVGVVSALGRMHGRAIQSDANASAANYGGPLVDLQGRVLGVLVPMAPPSPGTAETNELAGAEFYDSGIAFAVPLDHILATLDRWIADGDLKRGLLGVGMADGSPHSTPPTITAIWPHSPAADANWEVGDVVVAVDGQPVETQMQLRFQVNPRYAGDALQVTVRRGEGDAAKEIESKITLAAELESFRHAFLGVLPVRPSGEQQDDDEPGVVVRTVWPGSPAAKAGLEPGDRITKLGDKDVESLDDAFAAINAKTPGDALAITARRGDETLELSSELAALPTDVLSSADIPPIQAGEGSEETNEEKTAAPELAELKIPELTQSARYLGPPSDGTPFGLLVWLGPGSEEASKQLAADWRETCTRDRLILLMPAPADEKGWTSDDLEYLAQLLPTAIRRFGVDPRRVVIAGEGKAGQVAYAFAFKARRWIRGVAVVDSPLPRTLTLPQNSPNQRLAVLSVETENNSLTLLIHRDLAKLEKAGYPPSQVVRRAEAGEKSDQLDAATRATLARWIDGLDRF